MKIWSLKIPNIIKKIYIYSKVKRNRIWKDLCTGCADLLRRTGLWSPGGPLLDKLDFSSCFSFAIIEHFVLFNWKEFSPFALWFKQCSLSNWNISCLRALQEGDFNEFHTKLKDSKQVLVMNLPMSHDFLLWSGVSSFCSVDIYLIY